MAVNKLKEEEQLIGWQPADTSGNNYSQMAGMSDIHKAALEAAGNSWNEANKAGNQEGMDAAHKQAEAIRALYGYSGGDDGSQYIPVQKQGFTYDVPAPTFNDSYSAQIDAMLNQVMNYGPFSYDAESDPTFKQYKDTYTREGQRAMQNTLGQVSARTGGLASSYAVSAAQQANNYYMQQLSDKIPELRQLAYDMYMNDYDQQVQQLGLLQTAQQNEYNRYKDELDKWEAGRDFAYGQYWDDYTASQDLIDRTYDQNIADRDYKDLQEQTAYERGLTEKEAAYNQALEWLQAGAMPRADILEAADITSDEAAAYLESRTAQQTTKASDYKPNLSAAAVKEALESGIVNDEMLKAYKYYYGQDWVQTPEEDPNKLPDGWEDSGDYYLDTTSGIYHPKQILGKDFVEWNDAASNYQTIAAAIEDYYANEGRARAIEELDKAQKAGLLNVTDYMRLKNKYRDMP